MDWVGWENRAAAGSAPTGFGVQGALCCLGSWWELSALSPLPIAGDLLIFFLTEYKSKALSG